MQSNVLFIMTDQHVWNGIGKLGDWVKTPNLDKLSKRGITFNNCYTNSPICMPARVSLATGLYPHNTGIWKNARNHSLNRKQPTWMNTIRKKGYETSLFGKLHLHEWKDDLRDYEELVHDYGYNVVNEISGPRTATKFKSHMSQLWNEIGLLEKCENDIESRYVNRPYIIRPSVLPLKVYPDVYVANEAIKYLKNYKSDKPWFCTVSFGGPHEPWDAPLEYEEMYNLDEMPLPLARPENLNPQRPIGNYDKIIEGKGEGDIALKGDLKLTKEHIAKMRRNYAGNITLIDEQIGNILNVLEEKGEIDNTIIIFVADHGEQNGDYELIFKNTFLNSSVKIPLIICDPDINEKYKGCICDELVELVDVGPTLVEMVGGNIDYTQYGKSLCPILKDLDKKHRDTVISEVYNEIMLIHNGWKIVLNNKGQSYMLFNLENDPEEKVNLASVDKYEKIELDLKNKILEHLITTPSTMLV